VGEVSNYRRQASGHQYFTLKDATSQLACVLFARGGGRLKDTPLADGMQVQVRGAATVYEARGQYQMNVQLVQAAGAGLLQAKFEALKRRLDAEGLFEPSRKRMLPRFPAVVGIVTSPTGAALRDMLNILARRAPWLRVIVSPARVQGDGAAAEVAEAIWELNRFAELGLLPVDLIVVARGGGSIEDLWAFNEEVVARAIAASSCQWCRRSATRLILRSRISSPICARRRRAPRRNSSPPMARNCSSGSRGWRRNCGAHSRRKSSVAARGSRC